jgi:hypothetical protein
LNRFNRKDAENAEKYFRQKPNCAGAGSKPVKGRPSNWNLFKKYFKWEDLGEKYQIIEGKISLA